MITIRREARQDRQTVEELTRQAFCICRGAWSITWCASCGSTRTLSHIWTLWPRRMARLWEAS